MDNPRITARSSSVHFEAGRRRGLPGRLSILRGVVRGDDGTEILVRSPALADAVASYLEGRATSRTATPAPASPVPRFAVSRTPDHAGQTLIFDNDRAMSGTGAVVGSTRSPALARRVAAFLNEAYPAKPVRRIRGMGIGWR
jgi:hypothetical protein